MSEARKLTKAEFIERYTKWMLRQDDAEFVAEATKCNTLDGLYRGKSQKIYRLISLAYHRGMRRGAGAVWEMSQPLRPMILKS